MQLSVLGLRAARGMGVAASGGRSDEMAVLPLLSLSCSSSVIIATVCFHSASHESAVYCSAPCKGPAPTLQGLRLLSPPPLLAWVPWMQMIETSSDIGSKQDEHHQPISHPHPDVGGCQLWAGCLSPSDSICVMWPPLSGMRGDILMNSSTGPNGVS
uniref:Uncharacterized protein n=1 Tax=Molossus molossus TaxID=27622 RepID=A0A7J8BYL6_MOLMO|nr:hypothetical protein HJG59_010081 [Molossus molossus]